MNFQATQIEVKLCNHFKEFWHQKLFTDCILITTSFNEKSQIFETQSIFCHCILLAQYSEYFKAYFLSSENSFTFGKPKTIQIEFNPNNCFEFVVSLIYENYARISTELIPDILKVMHYYKFESLSKIVLSAVSSIIKKDFLYYIRKFIELDISEFAVDLIPEVVPHFRNILLSKPSEITLDPIFSSISPFLFSVLLKNKDIQWIMDDSLRVKYIDEFYEFKQQSHYIFTDADKEELSSLIFWDSIASCKFLLQYDCKWLVNRIYKGKICDILNTRRSFIKSFRAEMKNAGDNVKDFSRWYVYSWTNKIADISGQENDRTCNVIDFIGTLGGKAKPFNPVDYGFILMKTKIHNQIMNLYSNPLISRYGPSQAFSPNQQTYFISKSEKDQHHKIIHPMIGFDLGPGIAFTPAAITVNSIIPPPINDPKAIRLFTYSKKGLVAQIDLSLYGDNQTKKNNIFTTKRMTIPIEQSGMSPIPSKEKSSIFLITMSSANDVGGDIMRVNTFDIQGIFEPK